MPEYQDILYAVADGVAVITLNRPQKLNAWTADMQTSVASAIADASRDPAVRVIVLTGAGRGFCAGADMSLLQSIDAANPDARATVQTGNGTAKQTSVSGGPPLSDLYGGRFGYLIGCPKPIIAAINGPAAGLGLVIALYADVRIASSDAKFTTAFAQRGLVAEHGISWLLPRLVGPAHALDLLLSARMVMAEEAERMGLVNRVVPAEQFADEVAAYARLMARQVSPRSTAVMKAQVYQALHQNFDDALAIANAEMNKSFGSEDFKEGVAHFLEKRAPNFTGR
jgi:enoyl-CoA hydratase/carnithine racemase